MQSVGLEVQNLLHSQSGLIGGQMQSSGCVQSVGLKVQNLLHSQIGLISGQIEGLMQ